ncbi:MAG: hypothetical protein Q8L48_29835 [Archangium sp.]|nr:hypothetical protein [Archangium sp.]
MASSYENGRVVVRPGVVEVDGRAFLVGQGTRVEAVADPPRFIGLWLAVLGCSLVAVPAAVVFGSLSQDDRSWLVAFPVIAAAMAIVRVLTASTRYHVALVERDARYVFSSEDLQTVVFLVAMVRDAIPTRREV